MSLLKSTTHISLDLQKPNYVTVYATQNDRLSRYINAELHDGPASFALPTGAGIAIAYRKPDGTGGFYDTLEDGSSAFAVETDGTVTIGLAEQALTVPGTVPVEIRLYLPAAGGGSRLTTWFFVVQVGPSVLDDAEIVSSDYFNVLTDKIAQAQQLWTQIQAGFGAPLTSTSLEAMTDGSKVYVYVGANDSTSTPPMVFGHWYYWDGSANQWQDGGVYQSAAVDVDATLSQTGVAADAAKTGALAAPVFSSATAYGIGQTVLYNGQLYAFTADHAAGAWIGTDATAVSLAGEIESAVDNLGEWTDAAYVTPIFSPATKNGLHFAEEDGALVVYGTPAATRRLCCLNGQDGIKTTSSPFSQTLEAGTYRVSMTVTGPATVVRWDYTYSTFSSGNLKLLVNLSSAPRVLTFTAPVMIGFSFGQAQGEDYGTEADPTRITLHIERLSAKDIVAREAAGLASVDTDTSDETGKTDRKMEILHLLERDGVCRLGPGIFYVSGGIDLPKGAALIGCGESTVLRLLQSSTSTYCVKVQELNTLENLRISGSYNSISTTAQGTRTGVLFAANQDGSGGDAFESQCCMMSNIWIDNFSDSGIKCHNTSKVTRKGLYAANVFIRQCWAGINIDYISEFHKFTNVNLSLCRFGCINNGGNNVFTACTFTASNTAFYVDGTQPNSAHGTISACTFCHTGSNSGSAIKMENISNGFVIEGCQIWYNSVDLTNCSGVVFSGCEFGRGTGAGGATINISGGGGIAFVGCMFMRDQTYPPAISITDNDMVKFAACFGSETGAEITA